MYNTILLAAALQRWERYSVHALAAREVAATLVKPTSKRLHILSAYEYDYLPRSSELSPEIHAQLGADAKLRTDALMMSKLEDYVAPLLADGIAIEKILQVGTARDTIVQVATNIQADLVIIGSHSKRGLLDISLGGTAQYVSRHAPCTVVLVSPKP
jgi:nucleotide-binding universal stress UspA family protein